MTTPHVLSRAVFLGFMMAISVYAEDNGRPSRPHGPPTLEQRAEFEKKIETLKTACATDIASLCADAEGPRVIGCLKHQQSSLSVDACQQAVAQIPDRPPHPRCPSDHQEASVQNPAQ